MKYKRQIILMLGFMLLASQSMAAGIDNAGVLDNILNRFATTASHWGSRMIDYAKWLFWGLALISMVWTYGFMALRKADLQEFFAETIRFFATTGFFLWILENGPAIATSIIDSLRKIAATASGVGETISPSSIVDIGFDIVSKVVDQSSIWSPASTTVGLIVAGIILVVLALVAINMLLMLITSWFLAYAGIFLLGFGGGRWTQDIAIKYYKDVLSTGMQIFAMVLVIGIGKSFIDQYYLAMSSEITVKELFVMLVVSIILLVLVNKIPPLLANIVQGGGFGGGVGSVGAGELLASYNLAAASASYMASSAKGASASMTGAGSALKTAFSAAQQTLASDSPGASKSSSSQGGIGSALGSASKVAAMTSSHLMKGAGQVFGEKVEATVANTTGGKIASAIREQSQAESYSKSSSAAHTSTQFDSNRVSGVGNQASTFVNKTK